ncbi:hypothetical protein [Marinicellulosiphila megalodicopiae]|uniref:hypothetical protein n=1 Tax=Marinicellulosiphila megalodicopiae TaxID=2724896 RepID=UPI003BB0FF1E
MKFVFGAFILCSISISAYGVEYLTQSFEATSNFQLMHKNQFSPVDLFEHSFGESLAVRSISEFDFDKIQAQFHIQGQQTYIEPDTLLPYFTKNEFRLTQINNDNPKFATQIDRANVSFATGNFEWIIGRQPLSVGVAKMANISQIYQPSDYNWLSNGYGYGVDAINVNYYLGTNDLIKAAFLLNKLDDSQNSMAYLKYKTMLRDQDVSVMLQKTQSVYALNTTVDAYLGNHALWAEVSLFWFDDENIKPNNNIRATFGADYAYKDLYGQVEYHFNGMGCKQIKSCTNPPRFNEYKYTGQGLSANHYVFVNNNYSVTDLTNLTLVNIVNVLDPAVMNQVIWSVSQNDHFDYSFMVSNSVVFVDDEIRSQHEFSLIPLMGSATLNFYF